MSKVLILLLATMFSFQAFSQKRDTSIVYVHKAPNSFKAGIVKMILRIKGKGDGKKKEKSVAPDTSYAAPIPKKYRKEVTVDTQQVAGRSVFILTPVNGKPGNSILYLHGGTFVHNISKRHWDLIFQLIKKTNSIFVIPDYPLAPFHTVLDALPMVKQVYQQMLSENNKGEIILMGDSAGGGFALSMAQLLKKEGQKQPDQIILLSPWIDISNTNIDKELEKKDPLLESGGGREIGKLWAGGLSVKDYRVSPIYGDIEGLGKISLFIGGQDILLNDARKFKQMMAQKGISLNYYEYPLMFHVWVVVTFMKEAKTAINQISALINGA